MRKEDLEFRINKCKETIIKKENLISKREKSINKKINELHNLGYKGNAYEELREEKEMFRNDDFDGEAFQEGYPIICDLSTYIESIKSAKRSIIEENEKLIKYQNMLDAELDKEDLINNLPENIKSFMSELIDSWNEYDKNKRERIKRDYNNWNGDEVPYYEFNRKMQIKYGSDYYNFKYKSDAQIEKENEKAGKDLILDFIDRVSYKTGSITSFDNLSLDRNNRGCAILNGTVEGVKGIAKVESIYAGGYNIQRLHIRVLVK